MIYVFTSSSRESALFAKSNIFPNICIVLFRPPEELVLRETVLISLKVLFIAFPTIVSFANPSSMSEQMSSNYQNKNDKTQLFLFKSHNTEQKKICSPKKKDRFTNFAQIKAIFLANLRKHTQFNISTWLTSRTNDFCHQK